jgi:hypothetical protein
MKRELLPFVVGLLSLCHGTFAQAEEKLAQILFVASKNLSSTLFTVTPEARCVAEDSGMRFSFHANTTEPEQLGLGQGVPFIIAAGPPKGQRGCSQRVLFIPQKRLKYVAVFHAAEGSESCSLDVVAVPVNEVVERLQRQDVSWGARKAATQIPEPCTP